MNATLSLVVLLAVMWVPCILRDPIYIWQYIQVKYYTRVIQSMRWILQKNLHDKALFLDAFFQGNGSFRIANDTHHVFLYWQLNLDLFLYRGAFIFHSTPFWFTFIAAHPYEVRLYIVFQLNIFLRTHYNFSVNFTSFTLQLPKIWRHLGWFIAILNCWK